MPVSRDVLPGAAEALTMSASLHVVESNEVAETTAPPIPRLQAMEAVNCVERHQVEMIEQVSELP